MFNVNTPILGRTQSCTYKEEESSAIVLRIQSQQQAPREENAVVKNVHCIYVLKSARWRP